jgi:uncharacterized protein YtpQ (UPF0354 family)/predicted small lipoprotein YifL
VRAVLSWAALLAVIAALAGCNDKKNPISGPLTIADFKDKAAAAVTIQSDLEGKPGFGAKVDVASPTSLNTFSESVQTSYAEYRKNPQNVDAVLKKFVDNVQARMSRGNQGVTFKDARAKVLPILKPKASFRRVTDDPATTTFPGDLQVAYAVQEPDSFTLVSRADLDRWHKSIGEVDELALTNLLKETNKEQPLKCEQKLCGWASGDGYDATRFIVPELRAQIVKKIGPAVYAVPRESVYVALPVKYASRIRDKVERDFVTGTNPVSRDLFVERDGQVVVLEQ